MSRGARVLSSLVLAVATAASVHATPTGGRERMRLDRGWRFALGHASDPARDFGHGTGYFSYLAKAGFGDGPASPLFDDRGWRSIDLPHDWAVEAPFDPKASPSHGFKAVGRGFPERSVGWYRRSFFVPGSDLGRRLRIELDGVYRDARVFVNGFLVGEEPSGYLGVSYDVSAYLNYGGDNVVAVRVDASMEEGWYYEGAGIYRHVWLLKTDPLHVARHGVSVRTELEDGDASVLVETSLDNEGRVAAPCVLEQTVVSEDGRTLAAAEPVAVELAAGATRVLRATLRVGQPRLWSLETPVLHTLVSVVRQDGKVVDRTETRFGIRSIRFDPNAGFFLNGRRVELKGSNNHQDHAGVGVAVPDALLEFRVRRLKEMGSNAYRSSHHPPAPELLDLCDRLGMLVIDENRLMGTNEMHLRQLDQLIRRDRNHPSVILWSLGNEEWAIEGQVGGARVTVPMQDYANRLDPTRLTTVAISGGWGGISTVVQAAGVNYVRQSRGDRQHVDYPWQVILGTEETTTQATRGIYVDDRPRAHLAPLEDGSSGGNAEVGWQYYAARPYAAGLFFWTGFDYRGEPTPFGFPAIGSQFGILDSCGFPKDGFFYLQSWWGQEDVLHVFPHWNWSGREGQAIEVRAHSNLEQVELFLNGVSQGRKKMAPNGHLAWQVPYAAGTLLARGYRAGRAVLERKVGTTGPAAALALQADRTSIQADGRDLAVVTVALRDRAGRVVPTANQRVDFKIQGPGRILGVGNGDPSCLEPDRYVESVRTEDVGKWSAPDPAVTEGSIVFEARFDTPRLAPGEAAALLLNALGPRQSAFLNGSPIYVDAEPSKARSEVPARDWLPRDNVLRIEAARFADWRRREGLQQYPPASLRISTPSAPWSRSTFNGLAQVIVQSNGEPGLIALSASGEGVAPATIQLQAAAEGTSMAPARAPRHQERPETRMPEVEATPGTRRARRP
jgi:beta-galactosidase